MKKNYKKIMSLAAILLAVNFVFSLAAPVLAAPAAGTVDDLWGGAGEKEKIQINSGLPDNTQAGDVRTVVARVIRIILGFLGILAVVIILFAGFKWMTSGGSEDKVGEAKKMLTAGIIGLIIILSAMAVADFVLEKLYDATTA